MTSRGKRAPAGSEPDATGRSPSGSRANSAGSPDSSATRRGLFSSRPRYSTPDPPSATRRGLFTAAMLAIPVLFFVLLEFGLRLAGFGASYPLFEPVEGAPDLLTQNREVARRYFTQQLRVPTGIGDVFEREKSPGTFRIFVQGGSSAAGYPYYYGGASSRMLAQRLQQTFPDRKIEVVNTAMAAVNSYTLLDFAPEIIAQQPDAILIYAGHNEFYGALGVGSAESLGRSRTIVRLYLALQDWRTVQALRAVLSKAAGLLSGQKAGAPPGATLMERMVGEQEIPLGSPVFRAGIEQFRANLRDLLQAYRSRGIPVFVATVASNERDHPPFLSNPGPATDAEAWQRELAQSRSVLTAGGPEAALAALDRMAERDSMAADVEFVRGRALDQLGRYADARAAYIRAKDRDRLRFRAPEAINAVIREEALAAGAVVVDARQALSDASPGGVIDGTLMLEHLHPNVEGYFVIADAFYDAMRNESTLSPWTPVPEDAARAELLVTPIDSLYGAYRVLQLKGSWPFKAPGQVWRDTLKARSPLEAIAIPVFRGETNWFEGTSALRALQEQEGDFKGALQTTLAQIQQYPFLPGPYAAAGELLLRQRRAQEAITYFQAALEREESAPVHAVIGDIEAALGRQDRALSAFESALRLDPNNGDYVLKLGRSHALLGDTLAAAATLRDFAARNPDEGRVRQVLSSLEAILNR